MSEDSVTVTASIPDSLRAPARDLLARAAAARLAQRERAGDGTFTTLKNAQAIGDPKTLRALGRPAERVRLPGDDPVSALRALTARIKEPR